MKHQKLESGEGRSGSPSRPTIVQMRLEFSRFVGCHGSVWFLVNIDIRSSCAPVGRSLSGNLLADTTVQEMIR